MKITILCFALFLLISTIQNSRSFMKQSVDCDAPVEVGPCKARIRSFYYDSDRNDCLEFNYGGCQGNGNRFQSRKECLNNCRKN